MTAGDIVAEIIQHYVSLYHKFLMSYSLKVGRGGGEIFKKGGGKGGAGLLWGKIGTGKESLLMR
jgi:hypothetical protein